MIFFSIAVYNVTEILTTFFDSQPSDNRVHCFEFGIAVISYYVCASNSFPAQRLFQDGITIKDSKKNRVMQLRVCRLKTLLCIIYVSY